MNVEGLYNTMKKLEQYYSDKFTFTLEEAKEKWEEEPLGKMKLDLKEPNKILPRYRTTNRKVICQCENNHFFPVRKEYFNTKYYQCPICDNTAIKALGEKYHRLTIIELDHIQGYEIYFKCLCDCGKYTIVTYNYLKRKENPIQSCGCL